MDDKHTHRVLLIDIGLTAAIGLQSYSTRQLIVNLTLIYH